MIRENKNKKSDQRESHLLRVGLVMVAIFRRTGLDMAGRGVVGLCSAGAGGLLMTYRGVDTDTVEILLGAGE